MVSNVVEDDIIVLLVMREILKGVVDHVISTD